MTAHGSLLWLMQGDLLQLAEDMRDPAPLPDVRREDCDVLLAYLIALPDDEAEPREYTLAPGWRSGRPLKGATPPNVALVNAALATLRTPGALPRAKRLEIADTLDALRKALKPTGRRGAPSLDVLRTRQHRAAVATATRPEPVPGELTFVNRDDEPPALDRLTDADRLELAAAYVRERCPVGGSRVLFRQAVADAVKRFAISPGKGGPDFDPPPPAARVRDAVKRLSKRSK